MSGPPYPSETAGSNGIGLSAIGVLQIGAIPQFNVWAPILSQYKNSPQMDAMIIAFNSAIDQTANMSNLYDMIWNVLTAEGYGLDVWGRIVGVSRTISISGSVGYLGFNEAGPAGWVGFNQGILFSGGSPIANYIFNDIDFRRLILAKAATNICDGSIPSINKILLNLFPNRGRCYVADGLNMTMTYTFHFLLTPVDLAIVQFSGALPQPAGVSVIISQSSN